MQEPVQAILVANVSFLGYVTPPGGPHPYWETCNNRIYVAFMVLNGLAFLFSLGATGAALLVPCTGDCAMRCLCQIDQQVAGCIC